MFCIAACWQGGSWDFWTTVPFTHSPVSSFLLFFWYFVSPPTLIFHLVSTAHESLQSLFVTCLLSLSLSHYWDPFNFFPCFIQLYLYGTKIQLSALVLFTGGQQTDIIAQNILILTKFMLHKRIWVLVDLSKVTSSRRHFLVFDKIQWKGKVNLLNSGYNRSTSVPAQGLVEGKSVWLELEHLQHWSALFLLLRIHEIKLSVPCMLLAALL